jgi:hypothetical protein
MKNSCKILKMGGIFVLSFLTFSCNSKIDFGNSVEGSGKIVKEERKLTGFINVTVKSGVECEIKQADSYKITVEADDNVISEIDTKVENNTLIISSTFDNFYNEYYKVLRENVLNARKFALAEDEKSTIVEEFIT